MEQKTTTIKNFKLPYPLTGNCFVFGRVGAGKTAKTLVVAHAYQSRGYKLWDIDGGKRQEGGFQCFGNDDFKLWEEIQHEIGMEFKVSGPKEMNCNINYPMFSKKLPKRLPNMHPRVKCKVFTISIDEIDEKDVALVLGPLSNTMKGLFQRVKENLDKNADGRDIEFLFDTIFKKQKKSQLYELFFKPLIDNNLISKNNCSLNLDLISESEEKDAVFILQMDYVPERFQLFIKGNIMRRLFDLLKENKIHKKNIAYFREMSSFMKVVDSDKNKEATTQIFRNIIVDNARYSRSGLFIFGDTQSSKEVSGICEGSEDILMICELPSAKDREETCLPMKRDRRMNDAQIRYIATMPIHQVCIVTRGKKALILKRIHPPRTKYWKVEYGNFISHWQKEYDRWINTNEFVDIIKEEYKIRDEICIAKSPIEFEEEYETKEKVKEILMDEEEKENFLDNDLMEDNEIEPDDRWG